MNYQATYRSALGASWWANAAQNHISLPPLNNPILPFSTHRSMSLRTRRRQPLESASGVDQCGLASIVALW